MGGRILAINQGMGYRPILNVQTIQFIPSTTTPSTFLFGQRLLPGTSSPFSADDPTSFTTYLNQYVGVAALWDQLQPASQNGQNVTYTVAPMMPVKLVLEQQLMLVAAGKDPVAGYWVQFAGAINLFSQSD